MSDYLDEVIEHYGVKGMKWGVRKDPDRVSSRKQRRLDRKAAKKAKKTLAAKKEIKKISKQPLSESNKPNKKKVDLSLLLTDDDIAQLQAEWNRIERSEGKKPTKLIIEE